MYKQTFSQGFALRSKQARTPFLANQQLKVKPTVLNDV